MLRNNGRHNFRSPFGIQPSLVLDFAGTGTLDPRVTFTRSTTGTYYNSSGVLTTAAINAPRFDYNPSTLAPLGLLIEQLSTNLLLQSQNAFNTASYTKIACTATDATITAPDGATTGSTLTGTAGGYTQYIQPTNATSLGISSASTNTISIYLKAGTISSVRFYMYNAVGGASLYGTFNLTTLTGVAGGNAGTPTISIVDAGNGWRRVAVTGNLGGSVGQFAIPVIYADNGTFYMYGFQAEALAFPTSYIPTTSAQVTRASDNASMTGTNFSSWYNNQQGTVYSEIASFTTFAVGGNRVGWQIDSGSGFTNRFVYNQSSSAMTVIVGGSVQANFSIPAPAAKAFTKNAFAYQTSLFNDSYNGTALSTITSGSIPTVSRLILGDDAISNSTPLNGWIKKFAFYPIAFTSSQNQALTGS